jgi:hypothetical protein
MTTTKTLSEAEVKEAITLWLLFRNFNALEITIQLGPEQAVAARVDGDDIPPQKRGRPRKLPPAAVKPA